MTARVHLTLNSSRWVKFKQKIDSVPHIFLSPGAAALRRENLSNVSPFSSADAEKNSALIECWLIVESLKTGPSTCSVIWRRRERKKISWNGFLSSKVISDKLRIFLDELLWSEPRHKELFITERSFHRCPHSGSDLGSHEIKYNYHTFNLTFSAVCWWVALWRRAGWDGKSSRVPSMTFYFGELI